MPISEAAARAIARIEAKILDKINDMKTNGGTFLQQTPKVTVGGQPVAIRIGGLGTLDEIGAALDQVTQAVQLAGDIANLVQNPMSLVEGLADAAVGDLGTKLTDVANQVTGGEYSQLTSAVSDFNNKLTDFKAHTSNLSGLSSAISDTVPDFKKITDLGETVKALGSQSVSGFIGNTASALASQSTISNINDTFNITVQSKLDQILRLDANTVAGQTAISTLVTDVTNILNNKANVVDDIITTDTHNFNEAGNNTTAAASVLTLAQEYNDTQSVTYALMVNLGVAKDSTITAFDDAINQSSNTSSTP